MFNLQAERNVWFSKKGISHRVLFYLDYLNILNEDNFLNNFLKSKIFREFFSRGAFFPVEHFFGEKLFYNYFFLIIFFEHFFIPLKS